MKTAIHKKHLIYLITDDLINWRMISKVAKINPAAWCYASRNIEVVIEAMGLDFPASMFDQFEYYVKRRREVKDLPLLVASREPFKALAEDIYNELERRMNNAK
ncbi:MAG: hypothetical protein K0S33_680 [Bacteroidetes bacterium]|jgi:hypothetical protein|nr:hypothetical protein [Bacteroidota bacterium]